MFRYPDHHTSGSDVLSGFQGLHTTLQNFSLKTFDLARASQDVVKGLYGTADDITLFWSHHEKLCLIDGKIAFMGGLDMCKWPFRWLVTGLNCANGLRLREMGYEQ